MNSSSIQLEHPQESCESAGAGSPYFYPEFTSPGGERYLKKVLRQILPMALYRTWEICIDHQARGNECYLSLPQLAAQAGRCLRTIQKNIACLQARSLLVERVERKTFRRLDGSNTSRLVVVKDFTALYTLAHEYHEWLHAEDLIPPERAFVGLIHQNPSLTAKLRRFENYRRLLSHHLAAPGPGERKEERWLSELPTINGAAGHAPASQISENQVPASKVAATRMATSVAKDSPKRISETSQWDVLSGNSSDSAFSDSSSSAQRDRAAGALSDLSETSRHQGNQSGFGLAPSMPEPSSQERQAHQTKQPRGIVKRDGAQRNLEAERMHQAARATCQHRGGFGHQPPPLWTPAPSCPDHPLARSFVQHISTPFGDRNPKGSVTRILKMLAPAKLEDAEILLCLMHAFFIARDTRAIRPEHCHPETGLANRMPLFCAMFQRFVEACGQGRTGGFSWHQMEEEIAADEYLAHWWEEHQHLVNNPSLPAFNESGGEQRVSSLFVPGNKPETGRGMGSAPLRRAPRAYCNQNGSPSLWASGRTTGLPASVGPTTNRPDQYEISIKTLMAMYSAPGALQEVQ